ncbi:MAG: hypothetical protein QXR31_01450 [Zestosphaera sp.]
MSEITVTINSPTPDFLYKIINTITGTTPQVSLLSRVALYDGQAERDSTTSLSFTIVDTVLRISCTITATGNYTTQSIRIYDYNNTLAFEKGLVTDIESGKTYTVIIYISLTYSYDTEMIFYMREFRNTLYSILMGQKQPSKLTPRKVGFVVYIYDENYTATYYVNTELYKQSNTQALVRATITLPPGVCVEGFIIANEDYISLYDYMSRECIDISKRTQVIYSETINV